MNLSCALGFSSSFICSQYFNESNEADIAKGYLPTSLLQARFDEYSFTPIRNLQNFVGILSGKKSSYDSSRFDYLPLMLFSQNSGCMDSKSLNSIIILV